MEILSFIQSFFSNPSLNTPTTKYKNGDICLFNDLILEIVDFDFDEEGIYYTLYQESTDSVFEEIEEENLVLLATHEEILETVSPYLCVMKYSIPILSEEADS